MKKLSRLLVLMMLAFVSTTHLRADASWTTPFPPFRIAGNSPGSPRTGPGPWGGLYYVGSEDLASYLIATPQGLILINSSFEANVPLIQKSVAQLGFKFKDIKILLISHAHNDHCAGAAQIIKLTGAKYFVMDADVPVVETGGKADFAYGAKSENWYTPAHVDRVLHDGDTVSLGGTVLTAHKTAGHTRGTTTWTMDVPSVATTQRVPHPSSSPTARWVGNDKAPSEAGAALHVVIVGSPNVNPGYKLVNNKAYQEIATDYAHGFQVLKALPCDIFLGAHGQYFDLKEKYARWKAGDHNAFIDPEGYKAYIADRQQAFEDELERQQASALASR